MADDEHPRRGVAPQGVRRPGRGERRRLHRAARQGGLADRAERRREDDVLQHAHRRLQADRRARSSSSARTSPGSRRTRSPRAASAAPSRTSGSSQNMTTLENVLVGMHSRLKANMFTSILRTRGVKREEAEARERARELLGFAGLRRHEDEAARQPPLRRPAAARGRAGARDRAAAAAARRADRRHEPAGVGRVHRVRAAAARRAAS